MIITETCIEDAAEFSIDDPDERVCGLAYTNFLRDHYGHEGHSERMATKKSVFKGMTPVTPEIREKDPKPLRG